MMKKVFYSCSLFALFVACNNNSQDSANQTDSTASADTPMVTIQIPKSACYMNVSGKDTLQLKIEVFPNVVTGVLRYNFSEKDKSQGTLDGKLYGDTVIAEYSFMSEGVRSTREVAFLIKDSLAMEGYGAMEEKEGRMMFKQRSNIDFAKGTTFKQVSCLEYDPASNMQP